MRQKIAGILIDTIGPRSLQFGAPVAPAKQSHTECLRPLRREQVPNTIAHDHGIRRARAQLLCTQEENVRIGLAASDACTIRSPRARNVS